MDSEKIGLFIKHLREKNNLSQNELAEKIPIGRDAVSKWEHGKTIPDIQNLVLLSKVFGVTIDELISGEYKKKKNFVGNITTSLPSNVASDMKDLLEWYDKIDKKTIEDIIEFHVRFERIHPFQDGNGRVGRMIMFRECLYNDIMPFFIEDRNKDFYIRGIKEYQTNNEKGYLIDTCLNSQDNYEKMVNYFLEDNE